MIYPVLTFSVGTGFFVCVEHDTHLVQKTVPQVFTAKCSEPQAVIRKDMSERSG